jgi:hypothetical protein
VIGGQLSAGGDTTRPEREPAIPDGTRLTGVHKMMTWWSSRLSNPGGSIRGMRARVENPSVALCATGTSVAILDALVNGIALRSVATVFEVATRAFGAPKDGSRSNRAGSAREGWRKVDAAAAHGAGRTSET